MKDIYGKAFALRDDATRVKDSRFYIQRNKKTRQTVWEVIEIKADIPTLFATYARYWTAKLAIQRELIKTGEQ